MAAILTVQCLVYSKQELVTEILYLDFHSPYCSIPLLHSGFLPLSYLLWTVLCFFGLYLLFKNVYLSVGKSAVHLPEVILYTFCTNAQFWTWIFHNPAMTSTLQTL